MSAAKPKGPSPDPLIDEVRERRRALLAAYNNDFGKLVEAIRAIEREHPEKVIDPRRKRREDAGRP